MVSVDKVERDMGGFVGWDVEGHVGWDGGYYRQT